MRIQKCFLQSLTLIALFLELNLRKIKDGPISTNNIFIQYSNKYDNLKINHSIIQLIYDELLFYILFFFHSCILPSLFVLSNFHFAEEFIRDNAHLTQLELVAHVFAQA